MPSMLPSASTDLHRSENPPAATPARLDSRELLRGAREIVIRHGNQEYRLRHTQNDKLILTK